MARCSLSDCTLHDVRAVAATAPTCPYSHSHSTHYHATTSTPLLLDASHTSPFESASSQLQYSDYCAATLHTASFSTIIPVASVGTPACAGCVTVSALQDDPLPCSIGIDHHSVMSACPPSDEPSPRLFIPQHLRLHSAIFLSLSHLISGCALICLLPLRPSLLPISRPPTASTLPHSLASLTRFTVSIPCLPSARETSTSLASVRLSLPLRRLLSSSLSESH